MVSIQVHSFLGMHRATSSEKNRRKRVFLTTGMGGPTSFGIWMTLWSCSGSDYLHLMSWKHLETLGIARIPALAREHSHGQLLCSMGKSSTLGQNFHGYVSLLKAYCYWRIPKFLIYHYPHIPNKFTEARLERRGQGHRSLLQKNWRDSVVPPFPPRDGDGPHTNMYIYKIINKYLCIYTYVYKRL